MSTFKKPTFLFLTLVALYTTGCGRLWGGVNFSCMGSPNYASGLGTTSSPYAICSAEMLAYLSSHPSDWSSNFILSQNINMVGVSSFSGIGSSSTPFTGSFNGNNKTISNLSISNSSAGAYVGFFNIARGSTIQNLTLSNINLSATSGIVGGLVAEGGNTMTISGVNVSGTITGGNTAAQGAGGIMGREQDAGTTNISISNCVNSANITTSGSAPAGGDNRLCPWVYNNNSKL